jgi:O-antigen ligase
MSVRGLARVCDQLLQWGLVSFIVFTPFAFGTVEAWAIAIMEWGIWTLVLVAILRAGLGDTGVPGTARTWTGVEIPIALFAAFCALQLVPLPVTWLRGVSPLAAEMYSTVDVASEAPGAPARAAGEHDPLLSPPIPARRPVSVNPGTTWSQLRLVMSFAALFGLVAWWSRPIDRSRFLLMSVSMTGFAVSLFGLIQYLTWNGRIYWFRRIPSTAAFGPFVNHNHFAGYVGMLIPVTLCFALYAIERRRVTRNRDDLVSEGWGRAVVALFGVALMVVALFFSLSRGGILSSALGGLVLFILASRRLGSRVLTWIVAGVLVTVSVAFIAWIGADVVSEQMGTYRTIENEASFRYRTVVWQAMVENIRPFLATGSGLGTFEDSFAPFTPSGSGRRWDRAHNDYLQLLWETGLPGVLIFLLAAGVFVRRYWWPSLRTHESSQSLFRLGVAVSLLTIALHSIVDFNLQIGANGFLFAVLAGVLAGMHGTTRERGGEV